MNETGYIVRLQYLAYALDKATTQQSESLEALVKLVAEVDALERSFGGQLQAARAAAGTSSPAQSRAAQEAVTMSSDADNEVHRLLERRCRRAQTAVEVVNELMTPAREDLELTEWRLEAIEGPEEELAERLIREIIIAKRRVLERMRQIVEA